MAGTPHSARLVFRPVGAADEARLHTHWNRPDVRRYLWDDAPVAAETVRAVIAASEADLARAGYGLWILARAGADGAFVGMCGLRPAGAGGEDVEVLYSLEPEAWGEGLATEAAAAVLRFAFDVLQRPRVLAGVDGPNLRSRRVLERLGFAPLDATTWSVSAPARRGS